MTDDRRRNGLDRDVVTGIDNDDLAVLFLGQRYNRRLAATGVVERDEVRQRSGRYTTSVSKCALCLKFQKALSSAPYRHVPTGAEQQLRGVG